MASARTRRNLGTIADAADRLGCSTRTIRRYIAAGQLTGYRLGSRAIRVDLDQLEELLTPIPAA